MCHLEHEMERFQLLQQLRQQQQRNSQINSLADLQASQTISLGGSASHYGHDFGCCENGVDAGTLLALLAGKNKNI